MKSWYTVRFMRWLWSLLWHRRTVWALVCFVSLITVLWQWENWRSARELAAAHRRVVERLGTDNAMTLMAPKVSDEENYFANPVLESWLHVYDAGSMAMEYMPPPDALLPAGFLRPELREAEDGGCDKLDLTAWMKKRGGQGPEPAAVVLARELGDGNGLLPKLAEGLNKPFSIMKPGQREATEAAGDNPLQAHLPGFRGLNDFHHQLGLHLRSAALAGDAVKASTTALIMLRVSEGTARGGLIGCLVPLALHEITFDALHEALSHPAWTAESLGRLQVRLGQFDDLQQYQSAHGQEISGMFFQLEYLRSHRPTYMELFRARSTEPWLWQRIEENAFNLATNAGPIGWHDANVAYYANCMLDQLGPPGPTAWMRGASRGQAVSLRNQVENSWPNPRRMLGALAIPNVGSVAMTAAKTLFHRRCLIITCALEKHRMKHGSFPESLDAVMPDLKLYDITDPAQPSKRPGYRLEPGGYLLWSAGTDGQVLWTAQTEARDDGGVNDKDWLWRMKWEP